MTGRVASHEGHNMANLDKVCRILEDLKAAPEFLRQYPGLAAKLRAALEKAERPARPGA